MVDGEQPNKGGRPTKLTPELAESLCEIRKQGQSITGAAALCGIGESTLRRWLAEGKPDDAPEHLRDFHDKFIAAGQTAVGQVIDAAFKAVLGGYVIKTSRREMPDGSSVEEEQVQPPDWRGALEIASRLDRDNWAGVKPMELTITGPGGGPVEIQQASVVNNIVARVKAAKEKKAAAAAAAASGEPVPVAVGEHSE
ncbi:hypothetical protein [Streptosporangium sp. NPDC002524]|uniref:hypothetical protein n=1 Tax=Streptosporangium sp. NPDC002524 TaxID=3154537 RepID=UPI0033302AAC